VTWLLWRQHRLQAALAAAAIALFAIPAVITGVHLNNALSKCRGSSTCSGFDLLAGYDTMNILIDITVVVPVVIGIFWGATIVGKELESGTATLAWTQAISRRRWFWSKVAILFALTGLASGTVAALVTWWSNVHNATRESRFGGLQFDIQGVAPVGYALFAAALGLAAGVLWRRSLPAMATTLAAFVGVRIIVESFLRSHYMTPVTRYVPLVGRPEPPAGSMPLSSDLMLNGHVISGRMPVPLRCTRLPNREAFDACMRHLGLDYQVRLVYQPANRYWTFQWIEFGLFVTLAVIFTGVAIVALRRRDA
jgi:ABC-2 family transporter protein